VGFFVGVAFGADALVAAVGGFNGACNVHVNTPMPQDLQGLHLGGVEQRCSVRAGGPGEIVQGFEMDPGEGDGHQLQVGRAVAVFQIAQVFVHAPVQTAGALGLFRASRVRARAARSGSS
jgi:hypothetical protein